MEDIDWIRARVGAGGEPVDIATTRAMNREAMVGAAAKYLRPDRAKHCGILGAIVTGAIETISVAASAEIQLKGDNSADVERLLSLLGPQIQAHAEQIAHAATRTLIDVYLKTLIVSSAVPIDDDLRPH